MVAGVVVSDDASPATFDRILLQCSAPVHRHHQNQGIARSLNVGLRFAEDSGASWLLTVDQDSQLPEDYVKALLATARSATDLGLNVGAVAAEAVEVGQTRLGYPQRTESGVVTTTEVFQSGTLWSVEALRKIGGFDESLGIDGVDTAACLALRERGYRVVLAPGVALKHAYGDGRPVRLFGRTVMATGHSPSRRTTMVRNRLRLLPRELRADPAQAWRSSRRLMVNTALSLTVENDRWANAKASIRGLWPRRHG